MRFSFTCSDALRTFCCRYRDPENIRTKSSKQSTTLSLWKYYSVIVFYDRDCTQLVKSLKDMWRIVISLFAVGFLMPLFCFSIVKLKLHTIEHSLGMNMHQFNVSIISSVVFSIVNIVLGAIVSTFLFSCQCVWSYLNRCRTHSMWSSVL